MHANMQVATTSRRTYFFLLLWPRWAKNSPKQTSVNYGPSLQWSTTKEHKFEVNGYLDFMIWLLYRWMANQLTGNNLLARRDTINHRFAIRTPSNKMTYVQQAVHPPCFIRSPSSERYAINLQTISWTTVSNNRLNAAQRNINFKENR